jgi:hypothetical protein
MDSKIKDHFQKLLAKAAKSGECVEFSGCLLPNGYGKVGHYGKTYLAHRFAWLANNAEIPDGMCVCHKCDNRKCINPEHLFLGTRTDNMRDMIAKGRQRFVGLNSKNWRKPSSRKGSDNGMAVLDDKKVREIRTIRSELNLCTSDIAKLYGVAKVTIIRVLSKTNWNHVA